MKITLKYFQILRQELVHARHELEVSRSLLNWSSSRKSAKKKGVEDIIAAIQQLNTQTDIIYELDFYGHIKDNIRKKFEIFIKDNKTVSYKGV